MKLVIQRVSSAAVRVAGEQTGSIAHGLLVLLCIERGDGPDDVEWFAKKTANLRIFSDSSGKFNRSLLDIGGACLVVSQFTLAANWRKGNRPSFANAAPPHEAETLYMSFITAMRSLGVVTESGVFAAKMDVESINDGPVTLILDSQNRR